MKVHLLYRDRDLDLEAPLPPQADGVVRDLEVDTLLDAMSKGDEFLREVALRALLSGLTSPEDIAYRQEILRDCIRRPDAIRRMYDLAVEGLETKKKAMLWWVRQSPESVLGRSLDVLVLFLDVLEALRAHVTETANGFESPGLVRLSKTLEDELGAEYLKEIEDQVQDLRFRSGALMSARLGQGNVGAHYVLRRPFERSFLERIRLAGPRSHGFTLAPRDEHGLEVLAEIKGRGVTRAANAVAESAGHILSFFTALRTELGFYVACLNLYERLSTEGLPVCFPDPEPAEARALSGRGLVDTPLALHLGSSITASDVDADGALLVLITGPNRGGKSTFLRSLGIAQLMMQAGMFVTAASLRASVCTGIFTHFVREEDATMTHGKLDEELARMSEIVELVQPHSLLVCNESFASTNELEGSEIARHVVRALVESGVRVFYVTHLYDLAAGFHAEPPAQSVFLRAEWHEDGHGTFRVVPGEPLPTSHGGETYRQVFGERGQAVEATRRVASTGLRGASPSTTLDQLRPRCP